MFVKLVVMVADFETILVDIQVQVLPPAILKGFVQFQQANASVIPEERPWPLPSLSLSAEEGLLINIIFQTWRPLTIAVWFINYRNGDILVPVFILFSCTAFLGSWCQDVCIESAFTDLEFLLTKCIGQKNLVWMRNRSSFHFIHQGAMQEVIGNVRSTLW